MTITTTIRCDALSCGREREIDSPYAPSGWGEHDDFHYCQRCWPMVKKEIDEEEALATGEPE